MVPGILQFADLQELCRPGRKPRLRTVEAWLRDRRVPFTYDGNGGCVTTLEAFNYALGISRSAANDSNAYDPDELL